MAFSQARVLEWVAISFFRASSWHRDRTWDSCIGRQILYHWDIREALQMWFLYLKDEKEAYFSCESLNHKEHHNFYEQRNNVPLKDLWWKTEFNTHVVHSLHSQTRKGSKQLSRIWGPGAGGAVGSREENHAVISSWKGKCRALKTSFTSNHMFAVKTWSLLADKRCPKRNLVLGILLELVEKHLRTQGNFCHLLCQGFPEALLGSRQSTCPYSFLELCLTHSTRSCQSKDLIG